MERGLLDNQFLGQSEWTGIQCETRLEIQGRKIIDLPAHKHKQYYVSEISDINRIYQGIASEIPFIISKVGS